MRYSVGPRGPNDSTHARDATGTATDLVREKHHFSGSMCEYSRARVQDSSMKLPCRLKHRVQRRHQTEINAVRKLQQQIADRDEIVVRLLRPELAVAW